MKIKRDDELIVLINFVSRHDMRDTSKIWSNTAPDLDNDNGDETKARGKAQAPYQYPQQAQRGHCYNDNEKSTCRCSKPARAGEVPHIREARDNDELKRRRFAQSPSAWQTSRQAVPRAARQHREVRRAKCAPQTPTAGKADANKTPGVPTSGFEVRIRASVQNAAVQTSVDEQHLQQCAV